MSRAYCLTCNEQVDETIGGTCPLGHPVAAHDAGPEPWVGFAGQGAASAIGGTLAVSNGHRQGASNGTVHANGHHNGTGHVNGALAAPSPVTRAPANGAASDDLTAMLAEALREQAPATPAMEPPAPPTPSAPVTRGPVTDPAHEDLADLFRAPGGAPEPAPPADGDSGWDELALLAAQLQVGEAPRGDDGPEARADTPPSAPEPLVAPEPPAFAPPAFEPRSVPAAPAEPAFSAPSASELDALLAELAPPASPPPPPLAPPAPPSAPAAAATPPAPPTIAAPPPPPPPPPVDLPPPVADVGLAPAVEFPTADWDDEPAPSPSPVAPTPVNLANFTARGGLRTGASAPVDTAAPKRTKFGRKR